MNQKVFNQLSAKVEELQTCYLAVIAYNRDAAAFTKAVDERIVAERARDRERIDQLTGILSSVSPTAKRIYEREKEELEGKEYKPTQAECAAFDALIAEWEQGCIDGRHAYAKAVELFTEAKKEMEQARRETVGKISFDLVGNWIDSAKKEFEPLKRGCNR